METSLAEELILVAFDPERGKPVARPPLALPFALAGAVVMDLVLGRHASLVEGRLQAGDDAGDPVLDYALGRVRAEQKPRDVKHWVKKLAGRSVDLQGRLLGGLVEARILEPRDARVLGVKLRRHTLIDRAGRERVIARVHEALLTDGPADSATASLVALVASAGLVDGLVTKDERTAARRRVKTIAGDDPAAQAVKSAVQEVEAAVMAGVVAAIAASSVTSSGHGH